MIFGSRSTNSAFPSQSNQNQRQSSTAPTATSWLANRERELLQTKLARHRPMIRCVGLSDAGLQRRQVLRKYEIKGRVGKAVGSGVRIDLCCMPLEGRGPKTSKWSGVISAATDSAAVSANVGT
jgi:hypothetical protein